MQKLYYENQGTNTYLVYTLNENDTLDSMSLGMITNNKIPGIASTVFMQLDKQKYIKYNVSSKVSVEQFFAGAVNKKRLLGVFKGIVEAMISAEEYMIDPNMLLLDLDYIFADVSTCETVLICVPVSKSDVVQNDLSIFFKQIMFSTQFDQTENCDHVAKIINYLNSASMFSLVDFQKLLDTIARGTEEPKPTIQNNVTVQPQPKVQQTVVQASPVVHTVVEGQSNYQQTIQSPVNQNNIPVMPSAKKNEINQHLKVENPQEPVQDDKAMSMFYLLQHYNKENAAIYKAQKDAKKAEKEKRNTEKKKTKKENTIPEQPSMKVPGAPGTTNMGFAIPGQPQSVAAVPEPLNSVKQPEPSVKNIANIPEEPINRPQLYQQVNNNSAPIPTVPSAGFGETTVLNKGNYGETTVLSGQSMNMISNPYLIRKKNNEKILLNKPVFRIGKERSYVDYFISDNTAVSRSHACIITREGQYYVVDTNSTNHTYVNGTMINSNEEVGINSGDRIKFANEDFEFTIG